MFLSFVISIVLDFICSIFCTYKGEKYEKNSLSKKYFFFLCFIRIKNVFLQCNSASNKIIFEMKELKNYIFADFECVPRNKTAEVKLAKRHKYKPMKIKSCTILLKNGIHHSRPISEVLNR